MSEAVRVDSKLAPQSTGRLQAESPMWRVIVQDMPEQNVLLEAYAARK